MSARPRAAIARLAWAASIAWVAGCTLINSESGLAGPPLEPDADVDAQDDAGPAADGAPSRGADASIAAADTGAPDAGRDGRAPTGAMDAEGGGTGGGGSDADADGGAGDGGPVALYSGRTSPLGIAVYNGTICWAEGDTLRDIACAPTSGGSASQVDIVATQSDDTNVVDAFDVALDGTYVYWSNGPNNQIIRQPVGGGASAPYFTGDNQVSYIFIYQSSIWVTDYVAGATSGNVVVGPVGSGSMLIYPEQTQAAGVSAYNGSAYWGSPTCVSLGPVGGNMPITTVATSGRVTGLAVDPASGTTYFLAGNQQVYALGQGSGSPQLLYDAGQSFGDSDLAVDDTAIYWSEHDSGRIMRLTK